MFIIKHNVFVGDNKAFIYYLNGKAYYKGDRGVNN